MPRFGAAGSRWAYARGASNSVWAQTFNRQFRSMSSTAYLLKTCEYFPLSQGAGRAFPENTITGDAIRMLAQADSEGLSAAASADEAVVAYLSGVQTLPLQLWKLNSSRVMCFNSGRIDIIKMSPTSFA